MKLNKIIEKINNQLAKKCYDNGEMSACVDITTKCGYIEIELTGEDLDVTIWHNNNGDNECENLAKFIKNNIDLSAINLAMEELERENDWQDDIKYL